MVENMKDSSVSLSFKEWDMSSSTGPQSAQAPAVRWSSCAITPSSSCEMIILRNNSHGGIIRVCMGIFTTALRNKKNTSNSQNWPPALMKRTHFSKWAQSGLFLCTSVENLAKMHSFHQSKRSDNKKYAVEVRWGIFWIGHEHVRVYCY